jgi:hypothetical protein
MAPTTMARLSLLALLALGELFFWVVSIAPLTLKDQPLMTMRRGTLVQIVLLLQALCASGRRSAAL